jgi:hypothetical protein
MVNNITLEDIIQYYEIDIDNCLMTRLDLIEEMYLISTNKDYRENFIKEIKEYQLDRK